MNIIVEHYICSIQLYFFHAPEGAVKEIKNHCQNHCQSLSLSLSFAVCVSECALRTSTSRNKGLTWASCLLKEL